MLIVTLDGMDGVGKSTISSILNEKATCLGRKYKIIKSPQSPFNQIQEEVRHLNNQSQFYYYISANLSLLDEIAINEGGFDLFIIDRWYLSTIAYFGSGIPKENIEYIVSCFNIPSISFNIYIDDAQIRQMRLEKRKVNNNDDFMESSEVKRISGFYDLMCDYAVCNSANDNGRNAAKNIIELIESHSTYKLP